MTLLRGRLVLDGRVVNGTLSFGEVIDGVELGGSSTSYLLPGFIDTHVHGGGGADTMDGAGGVRELARFHLQHGTTTLYPTTITNPWGKIMKALEGVREVMLEGSAELPDIPGAHLEGPFISPQRLGAQPAHTLPISLERLDEILRLDTVRLVTIAPELEHAQIAAERFAKAGVRLSVGHSRASFAEVERFAKSVRAVSGVLGYTHLYNAMGGLEGRTPGIVGAALADRDAYAELIFDTHHVHSASFLAALHAKPDHLSLITDATRAAGMPDGETELGGATVQHKNGVVTLPDGTLAGSALTLDTALRNAVEAGVPLHTVSKLLSGTPARYMGLTDRGRLEPGQRADILVISKDFELEAVYLGGRQVA